MKNAVPEQLFRLAFTVSTCSHLGQAKVMADSLVKYSPDYQVIICLVDKLANIDAADFAPHEIHEITAQQIPALHEAATRYTPFELTTMAKPFAGLYLFQKYADVSKLLYFDTDILFYGSVSPLEAMLDASSIVISPHVANGPRSRNYPHLREFLNSGTYNTGFWAVRRDEEAVAFLTWWSDRLVNEGYHNFTEGMFVDQLWFNLVPTLFKNVLVDNSLNHNVGYWNLHERTISKNAEGVYTVNGELPDGELPLLFYHFSGYKLDHPAELSVHNQDYKLATLPALQSLAGEYRRHLMANRHAHFLNIPNAYVRRRYFFQKITGLRRRLIRMCRAFLRLLE